jgi:hypothetical protein
MAGYTLGVMVQTAFVILVLLAPLMQSATTPIRTGVVARQLTDEDVAGLEMVLPPGSMPWLLTGDYTQFLKAQYVEAFLQPTT